jgi:hypothetical protein
MTWLIERPLLRQQTLLATSPSGTQPTDYQILGFFSFYYASIYCYTPTGFKCFLCNICQNNNNIKPKNDNRSKKPASSRESPEIEVKEKYKT